MEISNDKIKLANITVVFFCIALVFNTHFLFSQNSEQGRYIDFVEVEVRAGLTVHGTTSVKILYEGLLLRNTCVFCDTTNDTIVFFKWTPDLWRKQFEIRKYIIDNNLYDIKGDVKDETFNKLIRPIVLKIYLFDGNLHIFNYYNCNEKIDILLKLVNDLIPCEYRNVISFKLKC